MIRKDIEMVWRVGRWNEVVDDGNVDGCRWLVDDV